MVRERTSTHRNLKYLNSPEYAELVLSVELRWVGGWEGAWLADFRAQQIETYNLKTKTFKSDNKHKHIRKTHAKRQRHRHYSMECGMVGGRVIGSGTSTHPEIKVSFLHCMFECGTRVDG